MTIRYLWVFISLKNFFFIFRVTSEPIQVKNHSIAQNAENVLPTSPTLGRMCRLTRQRNHTYAEGAARRLLWRATSTSMKNLHACADNAIGLNLRNQERERTNTGTDKTRFTTHHQVPQKAWLNEQWHGKFSNHLDQVHTCNSSHPFHYINLIENLDWTIPKYEYIVLVHLNVLSRIQYLFFLKRSSIPWQTVLLPDFRCQIAHSFII